MEAPKWTVLYNTISLDGIISRNRDFYHNKESAQHDFDYFHEMDDSAIQAGDKSVFLWSPTLRPYDATVDHIHLVG